MKTPKIAAMLHGKSKAKNIGCILLFLTLGLTIFFTRFIVPIFPILIGLMFYFSKRKLWKILFRKAQNSYELTEGSVLLEGVATAKEMMLTSPYFQEDCIGYLYNEIEYIPFDDSYNEHLITTKTACEDFLLQTSSGSFLIKGNQLDLKQLKPKTHTVHSLKPNVNDIGHSESILKAHDPVVIIGSAIRNSKQRLEIGKLDNELFLASTKSKIEEQKISYQILVRLSPWMCFLYLTVNYFLFFAPTQSIPQSDTFAFIAIFGLPVLFIIFWLIGRDNNDLLSQIFQYLAAVCIISSFLSFPLLILFYSIDLETYRIYSIFVSILFTVSLALISNYQKLMAYHRSGEQKAQ